MSTISTRIGELKSNAENGTGPIKIRTSPSLDASFVEKPIGTRVTILDQTRADADGFTWFSVQYDGTQSGFVREDVITILPDTPPLPIPGPTSENTLLFFETEIHQVRVFRPDSAILMNVYNKISKQVEVNRVAATKIKSGTSDQATYLVTQNGRTYQASFVRLGAVHLKITDSATGGDVKPIESGFNQSGSEYV